MTPAFLNEVRRRTSLRDIVARSVRLVRRGHEYSGLCPFHREETPSFFVVQEKGFFHCFGCGAHGDAISFLMRIESLDFVDAVAKLAAEAGLRGGKMAATRATGDPSIQAASVAVRDYGWDDDARRRREFARAIWQSSLDPRGTPVEIYLARRGLALPVAPTLRWAPSCPCGQEGRRPAMVARVGGPDGKFWGIHRTFLRADGHGKAEIAKPKKMLGRSKGGAVRLGRIRSDSWLIVAEGIETTLTVMQADDNAPPGWAALSSVGLESLELPGDVTEVLIFADADQNGVGQRSAGRAAARFAAERRRVWLTDARQPNTDANDLLLRAIASAQASKN